MLLFKLLAESNEILHSKPLFQGAVIEFVLNIAQISALSYSGCPLSGHMPVYC